MAYRDEYWEGFVDGVAVGFAWGKKKGYVDGYADGFLRIHHPRRGLRSAPESTHYSSSRLCIQSSWPRRRAVALERSGVGMILPNVEEE